jgi:hypothetical protein
LAKELKRQKQKKYILGKENISTHMLPTTNTPFFFQVLQPFHPRVQGQMKFSFALNVPKQQFFGDFV